MASTLTLILTAAALGGCQSKISASKASGPVPATTAADPVPEAVPAVVDVSKLSGTFINSLTSKDVLSLTGTCSVEGAAVHVTVKGEHGGLIDKPDVPCAGGVWITNAAISSFPDGTITVSVTGHEDAKPSVVTLTKDTTPPVITLTAPTLKIGRASATQQYGVVAQDAVSDIVKLSYQLTTDGKSYGKEVILKPDATDVSFAIPTITKTSSAAAVRVTAVDQAGNQTTAQSKPFVIPVDDGQAKILLPIGATVLQTGDLAATEVEGDCARPTQKVKVTVAGASATVPCTGGQWQKTLDLSGAADGDIAINADFLNELGGKDSDATVTVVKDTSAPVVSFLRAVDPFLIRGESMPVSLSALGTGTAITSLSYQLSFDDGTSYDPPVSLASAASAFSVVWSSGLPSTAAARIKITAVDAAGNAGIVVSDSMAIASSTDKLAGTGSFETSYGHADGTPDQARFHNPTSITTDGTYLYVGEPQTIRRVKISDGTVDTLAGVFGAAQSLREGIGTDARVNSPFGMTVLGDYLYFTELNFHTLRRVCINASNCVFKTVSTVAGLASTSGAVDAPLGVNARLSSPRGVTNDGTYLYFIDTGSHTLRRYNPADTSVTTLAGVAGSTGLVNANGTSARFNSPQMATFDNGASSGAQGSIYISDHSNIRIRRYDIATTTVSTLTGGAGWGSVDGTSATGMMRAPRGLTADGTNLFFTDVIAQTIRKVTLATGAITTVSGVRGMPGYVDGPAASGEFSVPGDVTVVGDKVFVADIYNNMIRVIDMTAGTVSRFAGAPVGSTAALDPTQSSDVGSGAVLDQIYGITSTDGDNIYFNGMPSTVRRLTISTNTVTTIVGNAYDPGSADGLPGTGKIAVGRTILKIGNFLYLADMSAIRRIDLSDNSIVTLAGSIFNSGTADGNGTAARFNYPWGFTTDGTSLFITDSSNHRVRAMTLAPPYTVTTIAGGTSGFLDHATDGLLARFNNPRGLAYFNQKLYISDYSNHAIRMIDMSTPANAVTTVAGTNPATSGNVDGTGTAVRLNGPIALRTDGTTLFIADNLNSLVKQMSLATGAVTTLFGGAAFGVSHQDGAGRNTRLTGLLDIDLAAGKLFVGGNNVSTLVSVDLTTLEAKTLAGAVNSQSRFNGRQLFAHRDGVAKVPTTELGVSCIAMDTSKIYVIDYVGTIRSFNLDMTGETLMAGVLDEPGNIDGAPPTALVHRSYGCAVHGGYLYFTQLTSNTVRRMHLATSVVETIAGDSKALAAGTDGTGAAARFNQPSGLAIIGDNAYVTDGGCGSTIRKISLTPATLGQTTTLAGAYNVFSIVNGTGPAVTRFNCAGSIVAVNGYLYTVDRNSFIMRWIDPNNGEVQTVAGAGSVSGTTDGIGTASRLTLPTSLTTDGVNIWILDRGPWTIRKFRPATGQMTTVAGSLFNTRPGEYGPIESTQIAGESLFYLPGVGLVLPAPYVSSIIH